MRSGVDLVFRPAGALQRAASSAKYLAHTLTDAHAFQGVPIARLAELADLLDRAQAMCDVLKDEQAARRAVDPALDDTQVGEADVSLQEFTELLRPRRA